MLREASGRRAVEQSPVADARAERRFDGDAIEHRLQHGAAADRDLLERLRLAAGLVIGDAEHLRFAVFLDQVDGAVQREAAFERDRVRGRLVGSRSPGTGPNPNSNRVGCHSAPSCAR